jgi:hypothetical protein
MRCCDVLEVGSVNNIGCALRNCCTKLMIDDAKWRSDVVVISVSGSSFFTASSLMMLIRVSNKKARNGKGKDRRWAWLETV